MKKTILAIGFLGMSLVAADFSQMSTEELTQLRGTISIEDRDAFRTEMQSRLQTMTPEDRAAFTASRQASGVGMNGGMSGANAPAFSDLDLNGDGQITQAELDSARAQRMSEKSAEGKLLKNASNAPAFSTLDTNGDGVINASEFQAQQALRGQNTQQKGLGQRSMQREHMLQRTQDASGARQGMLQRAQDGTGVGSINQGAISKGQGRH